MEGCLPKLGPTFRAFFSLFRPKSFFFRVSGGLLVEMWPRFNAVASPKPGGYRPLWFHKMTQRALQVEGA